MRTTLPVTFCPMAHVPLIALVATIPSGAGARARSERETFVPPFSSCLMSRTCAVTVSPAFIESATGPLRSCEISLAGIKASSPPRSTNAPKSRTAVTVPFTIWPLVRVARTRSRCPHGSTRLLDFARRASPADDRRERCGCRLSIRSGCRIRPSGQSTPCGRPKSRWSARVGRAGGRSLFLNSAPGCPVPCSKSR